MSGKVSAARCAPSGVSSGSSPLTRSTVVGLLGGVHLTGRTSATQHSCPAEGSSWGLRGAGPDARPAPSVWLTGVPGRKGVGGWAWGS